MPRDSEATKARIFTAAVAEFAAYGVAGARVDRIAKAAEANKQLIYAYFGDKEQLFATVLERTLRDHAEAIPIDGNDLPGYADRLLDYDEQHPEVIRLLMWEALEQTGRPVGMEPERTDHYRAKAAAVHEAQQSGAVTDEMPAEMLTLLLLGMIKWPTAIPQLRRMLLGEPNAEQNIRLRETIRTAVRRLVDPP